MLKGLCYGKVVPLRQATVHPHPSNAEAAAHGYVNKCKKHKIPAGKVYVVSYAEVRERMRCAL